MSAKERTNQSSNDVQRERTIGEIIQIILRRKYVLIASVFIALILATLKSYTTIPVYESTAILKKEKAQDKEQSTDLLKIVNFQTPDEIETEMELVNTWSVLSKVIDELDLFLTIDKIELPSGKEIPINKSLADYYNPKFFNSPPAQTSLPQFVEVKLNSYNGTGSYFIEAGHGKSLEIHNAKDGTLLQKSASTSATVFKLDKANLVVYWPNSVPGSKVYFSIDDYYRAMDGLRGMISVEQKAKTNIFSITVRSNSPYSAALIANTITEKFRDSRIEQQKQTIRYSFDFIDKQLEEMQDKLKEAEKNLSDFKESGQILTIDASSNDVIKSLSDLQAEKMNTELQLADYQNKMTEMKKELQSSGYFDEGLLSPSANNVTGSPFAPFAALMKQLSDLELQRLELLQKRTENHPDVQAVDDQIKMVKQKLASYNQNTLTSYQIIVSTLEKKLLQISNMMSKYEVKMEQLPGQENKLAGLMRQKNVYEKIFTLLLDKREEMRMAELSKLQDIVVVDPAVEPNSPVSSKKGFTMIVGVMVGLFIGLFGIFIIELKNHKLVNLDDIERDFEYPIFAMIPSYTKKVRDRLKDEKNKEDRFVTLIESEDGFRETFRLLKTKLLFQLDGKENIFMVTSCEENTGKTTVVANLALSIAQEKKRVLVIDCDLKKGELSKLFGVSLKAHGLIDYLMGNDEKPFIHSDVYGKVDLITAGGIREDSSELLNTDRMFNLFDIINKSYYDNIIIDTPPVTRVVDTLILGKTIHNAILIVRPLHSFRDGVEWGINELSNANINIMGIVVNAADIKESSYRYRYGYGYGYSYGYGKEKSANYKSNGKVKNSQRKEENSIN